MTDDDPINLQGSGPAPISPRPVPVTRELLASGCLVVLGNCPVGLFDFDGTLAVMTEYSSAGRRDAYIVGSGEYFWGGTSEADVRAQLMVQPLVAVPVSTDAATAVQLRQRIERLTNPDHRVRNAELRAMTAEKKGMSNG